MKNCGTVFESTFNGWKGWILLISLFFAFIFWQFHHSFKPNSITFKELIIFGVFSIIFYLILFLNQNFLFIRKVLDFIKNSVATFVFNYGFVSALVISSYYIAIAFGLIALNPQEKQVPDGFGVIIVILITLIVLFSFNPTSLIVKGYMQRYDEKWKNYHHHYLYSLTLAIIAMSSIWLIWFSYMKLEVPSWRQEYIKVVVQTRFIIGAFVWHFFFLIGEHTLLKKNASIKIWILKK